MITLRKIELSDTNNIIRWRNNPKVLKQFIDQNLLTEEMHLYWMKNYVDTGKVSQFIIISDGIDVGCIFIRDIDFENKTGEYGIFIGEDKYRGKGIGHKASLLLIQYAFSELKLNTLMLRVKKTNIKAIETYEKLGFKEKNIENGIIFMEIVRGII